MFGRKPGENTTFLHRPGLKNMRVCMCIYIYNMNAEIYIYICTYLCNGTFIPMPISMYTYITLHYITLHYITLHYITLHYITLHYITLHLKSNATRASTLSGEVLPTF